MDLVDFCNKKIHSAILPGIAAKISFRQSCLESLRGHFSLHFKKNDAVGKHTKIGAGKFCYVFMEPEEMPKNSTCGFEHSSISQCYEHVDMEAFYRSVKCLLLFCQL